MAGESVCEQEHCLTPVVWLAGGQWVPVSCASSTFILLERALLGSGWAQENAFLLLGSIDSSWCVLFICFEDADEIKTCWGKEFRGGGGTSGVWSWSPSPSSSFELYTNPVSSSQQGNKKGVFSAGKSGEKMKSKLSVWCENNEEPERWQREKASSNMNTPAAGLRHLSSIFTLPSLEQNVWTPSPRPGKSGIELLFHLPHTALAVLSSPAQEIPLSPAGAPSEPALLWVHQI